MVCVVPFPLEALLYIIISKKIYFTCRTVFTCYYIKNPEMCSVDIALYACCVHSKSLVSPSLMTDEVMTKDEDQHHL